MKPLSQRFVTIRSWLGSKSREERRSIARSLGLSRNTFLVVDESWNPSSTTLLAVERAFEAERSVPAHTDAAA